jgi:cyclophilin family peptidyl-prolyl cis-trans isomerase
MQLKSLFLSVTLLFGASALTMAGPKVLLKTTQGDITIELDSEKAPESVKNFLGYVNEGFFNKTVFHRVMDGFMVQGGGFELKDDGTIEQKSVKAPIQNEAKNGLKNARGTVAMARIRDPHSATAQFFINHVDNDNLDYPSFDGWGYAVFGKVVAGLEVVDKIAKAETTTKPLKARSGDQTREEPMENVPVENVVITSATVLAE